ncbi:hypothetical protein Agub_g10268, partial [Astrephomene gubernaculifera]
MGLPTVAAFLPWFGTSAPTSVAILCVLSTVLLAYAATRARTTKRLPPGKLEWPIGGMHFFRDGFHTMCSFPGDVPRKMRLILRPTVLVRHYDQIKMLLSADDLTEVNWPRATAIMLGPNSVTFTSGARHRFLRRLLGPCFTQQAVDTYLPAIQAICERYCAEWAAATASASASATTTAAAKPGGGDAAAVMDDVELLPKMQKQARLLTFEVMSQAVAGFQFTPQQLERMSDAFDTFTRGIFSPLPLAIPGTAFARASAARRFITAALDQQVARTNLASGMHGAAGGSQAGNACSGVGKADADSSSSSNGVSGSVGGGAVEGGSVMERLLGMR